MGKLGHLNQIEAFEFSQYLCLVGRAYRPTLGWTSWFAPIDVLPNIYQFLQEPPASTTIQVVIPLQAIGVFTSTGVKEVVVRHSVNGKPTDMRVAVRPATPVDEETISGLMAPSARSYLQARGADRILPAVGSSFTMRLGSVDIPFACGTWNDLTRARRFEVRLGIDALLPSASDIELVVEDCFKRSPAAATLARLLTPTGWVDGGLADFRKEVEACLQAGLGDKLVNVKVTVSSRCVDGELRELPSSHYDRALRSVP
jgi:hypothetical protein